MTSAKRRVKKLQRQRAKKARAAEIIANATIRPHIAPVYGSMLNDIEAGGHSIYNLPGGRGSCKSSFVGLTITKGVMDDPTGESNAIIFRAVAETLQDSVYIRDKLENCLTDLLYALNAFADLYALAPAGQYETVYDFGDITYSLEEDRARYYSLMVSGKFPLWRYLVKFEGYTADEAKTIENETQPKYTTLFGGDVE